MFEFLKIPPGSVVTVNQLWNCFYYYFCSFWALTGVYVDRD